MSNKRFIPDNGEEYWYITDYANIEKDAYFFDYGHIEGRLKLGNVFKTKEEAERMLIKIQAYVIKKEEEDVEE